MISLSACLSNAARRALRRAAYLSALYLLAMAAGTWAIKTFSIAGPARYALAILLSAPLLAALFVLARYVVEESDEYLRMLFIRHMVIATGLLLAVCAVWGVLEMVADAPALPIYFGLAIWCLGLGLGRLFGRGAA